MDVESDVSVRYDIASSQKYDQWTMDMSIAPMLDLIMVNATTVELIIPKGMI